MATFYKINGVYMDYNAAHDLGYTTYATANQSYKSASSETWGESAGSGYYDEDTETHMMDDGQFFVTGSTGWVSLDNLALQKHVYPSEATETTVYNENTLVVSNAAKLVDGAWTRYLIESFQTNGWLIEEELPDYGWIEGEPPTGLFGGNIETNDKITLSSVDGGGGNITKHPFKSRPLNQNIGWNAGGNISEYISE